MKYQVYVGSHVAKTESQRELTHALIGQLDIEKEKPHAIFEKHAALTRHDEGAQKLTNEEAAELTKFMKRVTMGAFIPKVLDWFESEQAAVDAQAAWPDRINFTVRKVDVRIP